MKSTCAEKGQIDYILLILDQSIIHFWLIAIDNIVDENSFVNIVDYLKHFTKEQLDEEKPKVYKTCYHSESNNTATSPPNDVSGTVCNPSVTSCCFIV